MEAAPEPQVDQAFLAKALSKAVAYQASAAVDKAKLVALNDSLSEAEKAAIQSDKEAIAALSATPTVKE